MNKYLKGMITLTVLFFLINISLINSQDNQNHIIKNHPTDNMNVAITFDDGPHPKETDEILDVLEKYDAKATFFVVGKHVNWYTKPLIRASKEGHEIGNHTYSHCDISFLSKEQLKKEISDCEETVLKNTGQKTKLFRPPFGNYKQEEIEDISREMGYNIILWSGIDAKDWKNPSSNQIAQKIINNIKPGDIILLHDYGTNNTVEALDRILSSLTEKGYNFVTVSELLNNKNKK